MNIILLVEDEKNLLDNLELLLREEGYEIITSLNGLQALEKLKDNTPDLIISDIMMPHMNGFELFGKLKKDPKTEFIPFLFLTAKSDLVSIREGMNLGADDYLTKPFSSADLLKAVKIRLEKYLKIKEQIREIRESISLYVPHELRTPLVGILGFSQLILSDYRNLGNEELIGFVERIYNSGKRLHNRIEKFILLTDLNPVNDVPREGDNSHCRISKELVSDFILSYNMIKDRHGDFKINIEEAELKIQDYYLSFLIRELFENAVKFSKKGTPILVKGFREDSFYNLIVLDKGTGMTEAEISEAAPFRQFHRKIEQQEGNGLGLVLITRILLTFNGVMKIESEKESFTKIIIKIPIAQI
jgi:CheY-like chemotaxis protein/anti-sigma regulatory factor (Ser/Thr protein kinase)